MSGLDPSDKDLPPITRRPRLHLMRSYNYHYPDGEQCAKKTVHTGKVLAVFGASFGLADAIIYNHTSIMGRLSRVTAWSLPAFATGATFAMVSCSMASVSGGDYPINHVVGGTAAGIVVGLAKKSLPLGIGLGTLIGIFCGARKAMEQEWGPTIDKEVMVVFENERTMSTHKMMSGEGYSKQYAEPTNY